MTFVARRLALPATCLSLAVATAGWGEELLRHTGTDHVGTLAASSVALMAACAFTVLCIITMLLSLFPGADTPTVQPDPPAPHDLNDLDELLQMTFVEAGPSTDEKPRGKHAATTTDTDTEPADRLPAPAYVAALQSGLIRHANKAAAAQERAIAAEDHARLTEDALTGLRDGTSPEAQALRAQIREEISRDARRQIIDLGESSERLLGSLRDAKARVEADLNKVRIAADEQLATLAAEKDAQIATIATRAAFEEYQRVQVALLALNQTHLDILDPMQREAVSGHQDRVIDALMALHPTQGADYLPRVPLPTLARTEGDTDEPVTVDVRPTKKSRLRRR